MVTISTDQQDPKGRPEVDLGPGTQREASNQGAWLCSLSTARRSLAQTLSRQTQDL